MGKMENLCSRRVNEDVIKTRDSYTELLFFSLVLCHPHTLRPRLNHSPTVQLSNLILWVLFIELHTAYFPALACHKICHCHIVLLLVLLLLHHVLCRLFFLLLLNCKSNYIVILCEWEPISYTLTGRTLFACVVVTFSGRHRWQNH